MSALEQIKLLYLAHFSSPPGDRCIFQTIRKNRVRKIVECGIGTTQRAQRMIEVAQLVSPGQDIHFTGIDLFEARRSTDGPGVSLKLAHRQLCATGARIKLIPGDPLSAFSRVANTLCDIDLLVFSSNLDHESLAAAWFFVPRILHSNSTVFEHTTLKMGAACAKAVSAEEVTARAARASIPSYGRRAA